MKRILFAALFTSLAFIGCEAPKTAPAPLPVPVSPAPSILQRFPKQRPQPKADGEYVTVTLPCHCGDFLVYVPGSCPCFDKSQYPDLADALEDVSGWAARHATGDSKKLVGRYEVLTLECGCQLQVYIPGSSGCLEAKTPDLAKLLNTVYTTAKRHEGKP